MRLKVLQSVGGLVDTANLLEHVACTVTIIYRMTSVRSKTLYLKNLNFSETLHYFKGIVQHFGKSSYSRSFFQSSFITSLFITVLSLDFNETVIWNQSHEMKYKNDDKTSELNSNNLFWMTKFRQEEFETRMKFHKLSENIKITNVDTRFLNWINECPLSKQTFSSSSLCFPAGIN